MAVHQYFPSIKIKPIPEAGKIYYNFEKKVMKISRLAAFAAGGIIGGLLFENGLLQYKEKMAERKLRKMKEKEAKDEKNKMEK